MALINNPADLPASGSRSICLQTTIMLNDMPEDGAKPIIALDADDVLLDYHVAYRRAWGQAFGELPELRPVAFVDDFLPYLLGILTDIHAALVLHEPHGSLNIRDDLAFVHSQHADLAAFASWWISRCRRNQPRSWST